MDEQKVNSSDPLSQLLQSIESFGHSHRRHFLVLGAPLQWCIIHPRVRQRRWMTPYLLLHGRIGGWLSYPPR